MSNIEKRLADLEKAAKAAEKRAKAAEDRAAAAEKLAEQAEAARKRTAAQLHDVKVQATAEIRRISSMRDLAGPASPYEQDSRSKYDELKRTTVKTKDGRRHYYSEAPCYLSDTGKPPFVYFPRDSFVSLPADVDPSVTFKAVKVVGKDKNGQLQFLPLEVHVEGAPVDLAHEVEEDPSGSGPVGDVVTNTELNERAAKKQRGQTGPGAPPRPTPPQTPGANEPEGDAPPAGDGAPEGSRPSDTEVG